MSFDAKVILKCVVRTERWRHVDRGYYDLDRLDREFRDSLYSERGREILRAQSRPASEPNGESNR